MKNGFFPVRARVVECVYTYTNGDLYLLKDTILSNISLLR